MNEPIITVAYHFRVIDEADLRGIYQRYCEHYRGALDGLDDLAEIAEELITNLDIVSEMRGHPTGWNDLGLERE